MGSEMCIRDRLMAMYSDANAGEIEDIHVSKGVWVVIVLSSAVVIFTGLIPGPFVEITRDAVPILVGG